MQERTLRVLEFGKILAMLTERAVSDPGRDKCRALLPFETLSEVMDAQALTEEAERIYTHSGFNPVNGFDDITPAILRVQRMGTLSCGELLQCAQFLRACRVTRDALRAREEQPRLRDIALGITTNQPLEMDIERAIISPEEVSDHASSELASIRKKIRVANDRVRDKLTGMLHSLTAQKHLQEAIITIRNGRYVLPVKQEARQFVQGIVHDQSGSGATLFIEPMAVVEINNELKQLASQETEEIERILAALSARLEPDADFLRRNIELMSELDLSFAKALLSASMRGSQPKLNGEGRIHLKRARHPLLNADTVVPTDFWLGEKFTSLVVTGPNTGGKTVTLKTVGLLTLMAQAGLFVPADHGSELAVFDGVFADIGDEQSIEQSLSTFSGHMTNIVRILGEVTPNSLALFDELGAGTDPTEGAALAIAILETLKTQGVRTLATTHYAELKAYALTHEGVENAAVEFNVETLRPTYRLLIGVPGKSNAFEISRRLGLPDFIIEGAKERLSQEQIRFEDVIQSAEYHRQLAEKERQLAQQASEEMTQLRNEAVAMREKLEEQKTSLVAKAKEEARTIVKRAKAEAEMVIVELRKLESASSAHGARTVQESRRTLDNALDALTEESAPKLNLMAPKDVKPGDEVEIVSLSTRAVVLTKPSEKGEVQLQAGVIKLTQPLANLRLVSGDARKAAPQASKSIDMSVRSVALELDIRGLAVDEAIPEVDKYIDSVYLAGVKEVSIIHGKGTGALRAGIHQHLKRHPSVEEFRLGKYGEGEAGVTIVKVR